MLKQTMFLHKTVLQVFLTVTLTSVSPTHNLDTTFLHTKFGDNRPMQKMESLSRNYFLTYRDKIDQTDYKLIPNMA